MSTATTEDTVLTRIAALLNHAEKAGTEEEAATYLAKAQAIATRSAIDLEVARAHKNDKMRKPILEQRHISIGAHGKRGLATYINLFDAIASQNNVKIDIAHNSTYVIAYGFDTDIDITQALYTSLLFQMIEASDAYLRSGDHKNETVWREGVEYWDRNTREYHWREGGMKPVSGITARLSFQEAFALRIRIRLREARKAAEAAAKANDRSAAELLDAAPQAAALVDGECDKLAHAESRINPPLSDSVAMVLVRKTEAVRDYYKSTSRARGSWKGSSAGLSSRASSAGSAAGASARISGGKAIGGSRTAIG